MVHCWFSGLQTGTASGSRTHGAPTFCQRSSERRAEPALTSIAELECQWRHVSQSPVPLGETRYKAELAGG